MKFAPCIVIPIYNHKEAIGATVESLVAHGLPLMVVDDGSDDATQAVLAGLAQRHAPMLTVLRLPVNGGKGAAVMAGLTAARRAGHTHAVQIDADGQHDATAVPMFVDAARAEPHAVIIGRPVYDQSVPKARLYGRYLTHVWVWIETLSFTIRDAMCGFRVYPLELACDLIERVALPKRMDFDIEILVRLHWQGVAFRTIATRVTYAADGVSHFDMLWDNLRISRSHTKLVAGMMWRLPVLLARKVLPRRANLSERPPARTWWGMAERGTHLGMALLAISFRFFGSRATSFLLYPIVAYFWMTSRSGREASYRYFTQLASTAPPLPTPHPGALSTYRHMLAFAQSGLDKLTAWSAYGPRELGRHGGEGTGTAEVAFEDSAAFEALAASGRGALVIGSHLGNLEMTRALAARGAAKVTAVVYTGHARRFNRLLASANPLFAEHLLEVADFGPQTAMLMQERIEAGELLVIVGDRVPAHESGRVSRVAFLGAAAAFAQGPYILANALACPVYLFFCLKETCGYRLYFEPFAEQIVLPRRGSRRQQDIAAWTQRYAARLQHYCFKAPYQWFNFFDFWAHAVEEVGGKPEHQASAAVVAKTEERAH